MKILLAQMNSTVGDFKGNFEKMVSVLDKAENCDLLVFPECAICGYPPQDLLEYPQFVQESERYAEQLVRHESHRNFIFGSVERNRECGKPLRNTALFVSEGKVLGKYYKRLLPTYDVFDEDRFFEDGKNPLLVSFLGETLALTICEDIWTAEGLALLQNRYDQNPLRDSQKASILINISASPFETSKVRAKREMLKKIAIENKQTLVYCNAVGGNDSIIFDGRSYVFTPQGHLLSTGRSFEEDLVLVDTRASGPYVVASQNETKDTYDALVLGIRDYCRKQNFSTVALGLSGGIDSSVVACLAADALGPENVYGAIMPSRFSSQESTDDALAVAKAMQNPIHIYVIEDLFRAGLRTLETTFEGRDPDVTEENMQARIRGLLLMSISNKFGHLVLTTGNKSELAVGYCTLYGDMCGGLAPLADVYKTQVYELGREANRRSPRIPERVFTKAPSAELRPNQTDQDKLPPYDRLDKILKAVIENFHSKPELLRMEMGSEEEIDRIFRWIEKSEYKRSQMPLAFKVSSKAFGVGRRIPIVHRLFD